MNRWHFRMLCCSALVGVSAFAISSTGRAEDQAPAIRTTQLAQAAPNEGTSPEEIIIVTAQRRQERLQDVPISVVSVDSNQLNDANITSLAGIMQLAPAVRFDAQGPWVQPTIRGIGAATVTTGEEPNVGIYVDGYFLPNGQALDQQLLNIDNIQVLKGPQGTLFGRNTTGGAILVNTTKPSQTTSAIADVSYGSYNTQRYQAYATTGITDKAAVDVAGLFTKSDNYLTNIVDNNHNEGAYKDWNVRTGLKVDPTDNLSILFHYEHQSVNDPTNELAAAYVLNGQPIALEAIIPGAIVATKPGQVSVVDSPHQIGFTANNDIFQFTPTLDLGFGTLTSYSQFRREKGNFYQDGIFGSIPIENIYVIVKDDTISQEFLLTSKPGSRLQWTAGAYYFDYTDFFSDQLALNGAPAFTPVSGSDTETQSFAGFVDATYQALDKLYLTAGVRYTHDQVKDPYYVVPFTTDRVYAPVLKGNQATPRAVIRYTPTENSSVYASFTRGYKAGVYNLGGDSVTPVKPETISAWEVGYKYAEHALAFDLESYYYDYKNLQVPSYGLAPGTSVPVGFLSNAANSRIWGIEGDVRYELIHALELNASAAYLNAKYTSFPNAPGNAPCFSSPITCGANYGTAPSITVNATGFEMQRAPRFTTSIGTKYTMDVARGHLALSANLYYTSKFYEDPADQVVQPAYATLGLRAEWTDPSGRFSFAIYGDNVTGKRYYLQAYPENEGYPVTWGPPAEVFGEVKIRYP